MSNCLYVNFLSIIHPLIQHIVRTSLRHAGIYIRTSIRNSSFCWFYATTYVCCLLADPVKPRLLQIVCVRRGGCLEGFLHGSFPTTDCGKSDESMFECKFVINYTSADTTYCTHKPMTSRHIHSY